MSRSHSLPGTPGRSLYRTGCALGLILMLSACGYKGPLTLPPPPPAPDASLTTPPTTGNTGDTTLIPGSDSNLS